MSTYAALTSRLRAIVLALTFFRPSRRPQPPRLCEHCEGKLDAGAVTHCGRCGSHDDY